MRHPAGCRHCGPPLTSYAVTAPHRDDARPDYPPAEREDLVEQLHGIRVADPYRWLEDPADPRTVAWSQAQDELARPALDALAGRDRLTARLTELLRRRQRQRRRPGAAGGLLHPALPGQEHAVPADRRPGRHRARAGRPDRDRPGRHDHAGRLAAEQGGRPARLPALRGRREESVLRVLDVATGAVVDGPIDRGRYSPVAWLLGGEAYYYVRRLDPDAVPGRTRSSSTAGSGCTRSAPTRPSDVMVLRRRPGHDQLLRRARVLGRPLARGHRVRRHRAADRGLAGRPGGDRPRAPDFAEVQTGVDAQTRSSSAATAGPTCSPTGTPRAAGWPWSTRPTRRTRTGSTSCRRTRRRCSRTCAILDGRSRRRGACWPRLPGRRGHAVTVAIRRSRRPARHGRAARRRHVGGLSERPEGGHEAWFGYTDSATPSSVLRYDARPAR